MDLHMTNPVPTASGSLYRGENCGLVNSDIDLRGREFSVTVWLYVIDENYISGIDRGNIFSAHYNSDFYTFDLE